MAQFKSIVRDLNIVPAYASDYKATMTYKYLSKVDDSDNSKNLDHMELLLGTFLLFSTSLKIQDLFLFDSTGEQTPEDKELYDQIRSIQMKHRDGAQDIILENERLSE